jgi:6-phosphogluconolactonase/glucosamine-6-phosphate isomerase/deaminase
VQTYPMLEVGVNVETVVATYDRLLRDLLDQADYRIGLFGVGADGHTGGLLPHNPLMRDENQLVGHFKGPDYERITVTPALVRTLDDKVVYVLGKSKWPAITSMLKDGPIDEIPARILTKNGNVTIFTDYKGETA